LHTATIYVSQFVNAAHPRELDVTDPIDACLRTLRGHFLRQRPLRRGSLLMTLLGDAIAPRGGRVTLGSLIQLAQPLGLPERLVRTSVARLAQDGWLAARRSGRRSEYALTPGGRRRFAAATRRIYAARPHSWNRSWTLIMLAPQAQAQRRERLRDELHWLGFGQFAPDVFGHPSFGADVRARLAEAGVDKRVIILEARSAAAGEDRLLARSGWDLAELARAYRRFVAAFAPLAAALRAGAVPAPEAAFVARTLLIHEYRRIHLRDPALPDVLLPDDWVGTAAYNLCRELYRALYRAAERHLTLHARTLKGVLPVASREARGRFARAGSARLKSDSRG
jgi:phenylacetic acid degradation operon negative regulatory protein